MSVIEKDKIDAMGISKDGTSLIVMIADHLDWEQESNHLYILQDKINSYLNFIESKQYTETYPNTVFEYYIIDIQFKYSVTENCLKFLDTINKQLKEFSIQVIKNIGE